MPRAAPTTKAEAGYRVPDSGPSMPHQSAGFVDLLPNVRIEAANQPHGLPPIVREPGTMIPFAKVVSHMTDDLRPIDRLQQDGEFGCAVPFLGSGQSDVIAHRERPLHYMESERMEKQILSPAAVGGQKPPGVEYTGLALEYAGNTEARRAQGKEADSLNSRSGAVLRGSVTTSQISAESVPMACTRIGIVLLSHDRLAGNL